MSDQAQNLAPATPPAPQDRDQTRRLERTLAEVRADAQVEPRRYARDGVVPEGGE